jgi:hypothetical protein
MTTSENSQMTEVLVDMKTAKTSYSQATSVNEQVRTPEMVTDKTIEQEKIKEAAPKEEQKPTPSKGKGNESDMSKGDKIIF